MHCAHCACVHVIALVKPHFQLQTPAHFLLSTNFVSVIVFFYLQKGLEESIAGGWSACESGEIERITWQVKLMVNHTVAPACMAIHVSIVLLFFMKISQKINTT